MLKRVFRALLTVAGLLAVLALTLAAFGLPVFESLRLIAEGAFGDKFGLARTAVKATPLVLTGLGAAVAWRAGMYNIGGEGQFAMGSLLGCLFAKLMLRLPSPPSSGLTILGILICCAIGGAAWAWIAGWLYVRRGVEVVIGTILLNFVALQAFAWAVTGPLQEAKGQLPLTDRLPDALMLPRFDRQTDLHAGIFIALLMAFAIYVLLYLTKGGYRLRLVGDSPRVARAYRIDAAKAQIGAMLLSGALCGLAGGVEYTGVAGQLGGGSQGWGFLGIPVALLAGLHPLLVIPSGAYFGALFAGTENLQRFTAQGTTLVYVVQAAAVLGLIAIRALAARRVQRAEAA